MTAKKAIRKSTKALKPIRRQPVKAKEAVTLPRLTIFQIKLVVAIVVVALSYRFALPIDSLQNQGAFTAIIAAIFVMVKPSPFHRLVSKFSYPKLMAVLLFLTFILPVIVFADTKYKDWDNAQLIKELAQDFPELVGQIEAATGLDLEVKNDCMTTTEKAGNGVRSCEMLFSVDASASEVLLYVESIELNERFKQSKEYENKKGYSYMYRNKNSCNFNYGAIYGSCLFAVRDANVQLVRDVFSN